jgi:hypothetical protein
MAAALRPMNLGEILDRSFEFYRRRFWLFVGIAALPALAMLGLHSAELAWLHTDHWIRTGDRGQAVIAGFLKSLVYYHICCFIAFLFLPAQVKAASAAVFEEGATIRSSLRFTLARWRSYIWLAILKFFIELVLPELLTFGLMLGTAIVLFLTKYLDNSSPGQAVVIVLLPLAAGLFLFCWVGVQMAFIFPAASLEGLSGLKALRRGWKLARGSRWRVFVAWLMVFLCAFALQGAFYLLLRWFASAVFYGHHLHWINRQVISFFAYSFSAAISAFIGPLYPIAITLLYYDQRVRKEAYDMERMMEDAGWTASAENAKDEKVFAGGVAEVG